MAFQHVAGRNLVSDYADGSTICGASFGNEFSNQDFGYFFKSFSSFDTLWTLRHYGRNIFLQHYRRNR